MTKKYQSVRSLVRRLLGHPSPEQVKEAQERMEYHRALTFEVDLGNQGVWRQIRIGNHMPLYNPVKPDLSLLVFRALPVIATPYLPKIEGKFFITLDGLTAGKVTWIPGDEQGYLWARGKARDMSTTIECGFRCVTREAGMWLHRKLAEACGMRFREHDIGGHIVYTRDP